MSLIKRIIDWFVSLFKKIFGKRKVTKKISAGIKNARNKRYLKGYGVFIEDSYAEMIPPYMIVTKENKKKLIRKIKELEVVVDNIEESEEIKKDLMLLVQNIEKNNISVYQSEKINDCLDLLLSDTDIKDYAYNKLKSLYHDVSNIMNDYGKEIEEKVANKYKEINYVTLTNVILDDTFKELMALEEDFKHHKYNKNYYNRKLNKIIERIENLQKIRDYGYIRSEIADLQKELYTKSKDKYDLLYNEEVFESIRNTCDNLLAKVNRRIVDIKKTDSKVEDEKKREKEQEEQQRKRDEEFQENLLKRFKDLELARKILLLSQSNNPLTKKSKDIMRILDQYYYDFLNGEKIGFYFERNKTKTELVKLFNNLNYMESLLQNNEFVFVDHINYRMDELVDAVMMKKDNIESLFASKYHYDKEAKESNILVNNKLELIMEKEKERNHGQFKVKRMTPPNEMRKSA